MRSDRLSLALIAVAALVATVLATVWVGAHLQAVTPTVAAVIAYTGTVWALAKATGMPPLRTLGAVTLLIGAGLALLLTGARHVLDLGVWILSGVAAAGVVLLAEKSPKASWAA